MTSLPRRRYRLAEGASCRQMAIRSDQVLFDRISEKATQENLTLTRAAAELMETALENCAEKFHDGGKQAGTKTSHS